MIDKRPLRIALVGGGSGGHITPLLAVAHQLKQLRPNCQISYIGQTGDSLGDLPAQDGNIDQSYTVPAGKLRRYHGEGLRQIFDWPTTSKNIRDVGFVVAGLGQSYRLLRRLRPDVVFIKGGFVGVPVGMAAAALGIPYITHDSDALPGLANRLIARWARVHAVALPKEVYHYPANKTVTVGVPIGHNFRQMSQEELRQLNGQLGYPTPTRLILVTGGGLGARRLNNAVVAIAAELLQDYADVALVHLTGRELESEVNRQYDQLLSDTARHRVTALGFVSNLYQYSALAEVVITRAGGNSMAEFAAQAKACIVVPNPVLAGGHQLKNAQALADRQAVLIVDEASIERDDQALLPAIRELLDDQPAAAQLSANLSAMARPDAAKQLAMLLLEQVETVDVDEPVDIPS